MSGSAGVATVRSWPGFSPGGALVLPLPRAAFADIAAPCVLDGTPFVPKAEFHATLLDSALGLAVQAAQRAAPARADAAAQAFAAQRWTWRRTGERWLLRAATEGGGTRESIVELLELPALAAFRQDLAARTGLAIPATPAHVTLYTAGDPRGIGLPSDAAFAQRRVRRLA